MKKIYLSLVAIAFAFNFSYAQWTNVSGTGNYYLNSGNVGIGTASPGNKLDIYSNNERMSIGNGTVGLTLGQWDAANNRIESAGRSLYFTTYVGAINFGISGATNLTITNTGNIGIGTTSPAGTLDVAGSSSYFGSSSTDTHLQLRGYNGSYSSIGNNSGASGNYNGLTLTNNANNANSLTSWTVDIGGSDNISYGNYDTFSIRKGGSEKLRVNALGNLLIGQTTQANSAYKLDVAGPVRANEIVVNTTGADFVFESTYNLPTISFLKNYIHKNHHLPEIPSAKQMQTEGLSVGENQVKLLQKVEELTLYLIEKDKQLNSLKAEVDHLKKQVSSSKSRK